MFIIFFFIIIILCLAMLRLSSRQSEMMNRRRTIVADGKNCLSGSGQDTFPDEPMAVGAEKFCNGDHVPDDVSWLEGTPLGSRPIW
jgi:hypothetical protein